MAEISGPAHARRAKEGVPQLVVDPATMALDPDKIVVKHTDDGGYFCLGIGSSARFLRSLEDDRRFGAAIGEAETAPSAHGLPSAQGQDPFLRRLDAAVALAKDGFDPDQPRDAHGRWSGEGGGAAVAASIVDSVVASPELVPALGALAARLLPVASGVAGAAAAAFGILFIPTNRSLTSAGAVPDAPDLRYSFDQDTGILTLSRANEDGQTDALFSGQAQADGTFRDSNGNIIGRHLGSSVVVDPDLVPGYRSRAAVQEKDDEQASARTGTAAANDNDPRLCPDPESDTPGWKSRSERSLAYQEQITGLPRGLAVNLNGVSFDGCRLTNGNMLEAKGPRIAEFIDGRGGWKPYFIASGGLADLDDQIARQSMAAVGRTVEWHVAEDPVADYVREYARTNNFQNINVLYDPPRQP